MFCSRPFYFCIKGSTYFLNKLNFEWYEYLCSNVYKEDVTEKEFDSKVGDLVWEMLRDEYKVDTTKNQFKSCLGRLVINEFLFYCKKEIDEYQVLIRGIAGGDGKADVNSVRFSLCRFYSWTIEYVHGLSIVEMQNAVTYMEYVKANENVSHYNGMALSVAVGMGSKDAHRELKNMAGQRDRILQKEVDYKNIVNVFALDLSEYKIMPN